AAALADVLARQPDPPGATADPSAAGATGAGATSAGAPGGPAATPGGPVTLATDPPTTSNPAGGPGSGDMTGADGPAPGPSSAGPDGSSDAALSAAGAAGDPAGADPAPPSETAERSAPAAPARTAGAHRHPDRAGHRATSTTVTTSSVHGALAPLDIPAPRSGFSARPGTLYLPPAFFASPRLALPVIVMVGGTPGGPGHWPRAGFAPQTADAYAAQHGGLAPILAFVDGNGGPFADTECVDG